MKSNKPNVQSNYPKLFDSLNSSQMIPPKKTRFKRSFELSGISCTAIAILISTGQANHPVFAADTLTSERTQQQESIDSQNLYGSNDESETLATKAIKRENYPLTKKEQSVSNLFSSCFPRPIKTLIDESTGSRLTPYLDPTPEDIRDYTQLIESLDQNDSATVRLAMSKLEMTGCLVTQIPHLVYFRTPARRFLTPFFWRLGRLKKPGMRTSYRNPVDPLIIESPHTGPDGVTHSLMAMLYSTKARILYLNGPHPRASFWSNDPLPAQNCAPHEQCDSSMQIQTARSDGAHSRSTMFFQFHLIVSKLYPHALFVQIHGMRDHEIMHLVAQDGRSGNFTLKQKSGARLLGLAMHRFFPLDYIAAPGQSEYGIFHGRFTFASRMARTKDGLNLFRQIRGKDNIAVEGSHLNLEEPFILGRFIHIELDSFFRDSVESSTLLARSLNLAMDKWVKNQDPKSNQVLPKWALPLSEQ